MRVELQDQLRTQFPFIETTIDCGDGWYDLIFNLCTEIKAIYDNNSVLNMSEFKVLEIKEKYGHLCYYTNENTLPVIIELITIYEEESRHICEMCGLLDGKMSVKNGWYKVLCKICRKKLKHKLVEKKNKNKGSN